MEGDSILQLHRHLPREPKPNCDELLKSEVGHSMEQTVTSMSNSVAVPQSSFPNHKVRPLQGEDAGHKYHQTMALRRFCREAAEHGGTGTTLLNC